MDFIIIRYPVHLFPRKRYQLMKTRWKVAFCRYWLWRNRYE